MRKILTMLSSLLVILFTTGPTSAQPKVDFTAIDTIISWGSTIFSMKDAPTDDTGENIEKILAKVNETSIKLGNVNIRISTQLDAMLNILLSDNVITLNHRKPKTILLNYLHQVHHYFDDSSKYKPDKLYNNGTLQAFANSVLYGTESLTNSLNEMYHVFNSGVGVYLKQRHPQDVSNRASRNLLNDCRRQTSPYQLAYYIYVHMIIAQMKGLGALINVYKLKRWLENSSSDYEKELEEAYVNFETGVRGFHQLFTEQLAQLPRNVSQCHVNTPKRGVDFMELVRFSRAKLIRLDSAKQRRCNCCLSPDPFYIENGKEMKVYNCKRLSRFVKACPVENSLLNEYSWWSDTSGTYGRDKSCSNPKTLSAGESVGSVAAVYALPHVKECNNWYCTVEEKTRGRYDTHSWRISSKPQVSDIWNDMVVTGVQFIVKDKTIHLQIQQGQFSDNGLVYNDIAWKDVQTHYNISGIFPSHYLDERIDTNQKTIYLDDISVPKDSVVTGIQLARGSKSSAFRIFVHATVFDFAKGKLDPSRSVWCSRHFCGHGTPTGDYVRDRVEINMGKADNPTKGTGFNYDPQSNKMIKFTHTDAHKDAGQTTIPFIDLQPVQVQPAFPLSGVGLFYRGKKDFGGYIAPRIYTLDVTESITVSENTA